MAVAAPRGDRPLPPPREGRIRIVRGLFTMFPPSADAPANDETE